MSNKDTEISTWKCSPLVKEYLLEQDKYEKKYGKNTIVLMQVGSFFEFYGINMDEVSYESIDKNLDLDNSHLYETAKILGFSIAKKTNNVLMAGSPTYCVEKHVKKLLEYNYTIVIIEQIGEDKRDVERKITNVYSPGTYNEDMNSSKNNYLMSIYVDNTKLLNNTIIEIGVSCIDLSIGKNIIYEIPYKKDDKNYIYDELYRFVNSYNPNELIVYFNDVDKKDEKSILEGLEINQRIIKKVNYDSNYRKLEIRESILRDIFKPKTQINVLEYLNVERLEIGVYSYIHLLLFIREHDNSKLINMERPMIYTNNDILNLNKNTIYRLNLIENKSQENNTNVKSLFSVIDMTTTNIGRRTLRNRLLFPITNQDVLNRRYDLAEYFINNQELMKMIKSDLRNICDLERINRKLCMYKLDKDGDLLNLYLSLIYIENILNKVDSDFFELLNIDESLKDNFVILLNKLKNIFNIENLQRRQINIFNDGYNEKLDNYDKEYKKCKWIMYELCKRFTKCIHQEDKKLEYSDSLMVEYEWSERDGCFNVVTTEARSKKIKTNMIRNKKFVIKSDEYDLELCIKGDSLTYKSTSAGGKTKIKSDLINQYCDNLYKAKLKLENEVKILYKSVLEELYNHSSTLFSLIDFIGEIDCGISTANNFLKYAYSKPKLDNSNIKSYIDCKGIRHPIIENIIGSKYVPNDVIIGKDNFDGMLLFGTNASGKSCLMKSIGLVVIMAQAGLYVPCSELVLKPYVNIFSRIGNQDNIFTGKSSFTQEMSELRDIFNRTNENSLILGDEPCSGTEHISAISIVSSCIEYLCKVRSSFIFATHLHKLNEIDLIKDLENLHMYHLKIKYDEINDKLIYDRKLEVGLGNEEYGLEVAKSLCINKEFMNNAYKVKNQLKNIGLYSTNTSVYNSKKIVNYCEVCDKETLAEEVHHIEFQSLANKFGHINSIHKNNLGNLCNVCEKCHDSIHNNEIIVYGYIETSKGRELDFKKVENEEYNNLKKQKKKYNENDIKWIKTSKMCNEKASLKTLCSMFEIAQGRKISPTILSKIINNKY